jgi:tetratricopeptide (TPR) repeat protein
VRVILQKPFIIIFAIGFLVYLPSLFGKFVWDDEDFVFANRYVQRFEVSNLFTQSITSGRNKGSNYFRPVQGIIYSATYQLAGPNPFWFHLINVLIHVSAACAIFVFFRFLLKAEKTITSSAIPFLVTLVFLIHPVQTEAVSYISGLSDPLFVLFGFLALFFFLLKNERRNMIPLSLCFFSLSLLSKETGLVFLPILALLDFLTSQKKNIQERFLSLTKTMLPFIALGSVYLTYHFAVINSFDIKAAWGNSLYANSLGVRLLTFIESLFTYISLLIFPKDLFMERDYWVHIQTQIINPYLVAFVIANIILIVFLFYLRKKSLISVQKFPILIFCYLSFFLSFLPYTGLVLINGIFYEHFLYLPLVFFFAFWLILLTPLYKNFPRFSYATILFFLLALLGRTLSRQYEWVDPIRFYSQTLSHAPRSVRVTNGLGIAYSEQGDIKSAIETYKRGIKLSPKTPNFYHNIANDYVTMKNFTEAEKYYLKAIEVDPNFIFSWQSLARLYQTTNQVEKLTILTEKFKSTFPTNSN